ncbi:erythroid membrane-associated protein-like [Alligator mississippiensis]|uniref:erythroid membrane-associated protein-like n=1 Tax=Alligator mississippiensis TaxID=8496 RepID=UPI002877639B|nr:erythroid membrane-associated protein-like [Alligator mississippiensis]
MSAESMEVRWLQPGFSSYVHLYRGGQDQDGQQMPAYRGRTQLVKDDLSDGSVSLRIRSIRRSDHGLYTCFVQSNDSSGDALLELQVTGPYFPWAVALAVILPLVVLLGSFCLWRQHRVTAKYEAMKEFAGARQYAVSPVDVTLDPDTAHPNLVLSEDRKCVQHRDTRQHVPDTPERFDPCPCVLGSEGFTGGRRYWEVEVGDKTEWYVGVCRESVRRKRGITLSPGRGYWVVWLEDGGHKPCTSPWTPLPVRVHPRRVGVFLDYEGGEVSFYNVTNRSHLFTFTDTFSGTLRPFFSPGLNAGGTNVAPLTLCPVPAQP